LQEHQVEMRQYEYSSLVQIQGWSDVPRRLPLFENILVLENFPDSPVAEVDNSDRSRTSPVSITPERSFERTNYPLTADVGISRQLTMRITYDRRRIDSKTVGDMLRSFELLMDCFVAHP